LLDEMNRESILARLGLHYWWSEKLSDFTARERVRGRKTAVVVKLRSRRSKPRMKLVAGKALKSHLSPVVLQDMHRVSTGRLEHGDWLTSTSGQARVNLDVFENGQDRKRGLLLEILPPSHGHREPTDPALV
jgi:hypothetical protein